MHTTDFFTLNKNHEIPMTKLGEKLANDENNIILLLFKLFMNTANIAGRFNALTVTYKAAKIKVF
jgi:hypothetical protein